ncbi:MAG: TraB/GumN family protein [Candidatus Aenigmatarchaeota archaeon]|nr:MAG: TraB/GumN family protein [Candidatus Aenigmarchaeota archaeon]
MITIVGTSHVSPESGKAVSKSMKNKDCVCVELDALRYHAITTNEKRQPPGIFLKVLHFIQQRLGKATGTAPGDDMISAVKAGQEAGIPVYLIDQDFRVTLSKLRGVPLMEKLAVFVPIFLTPLKFDLSKIPEKRVVDSALGMLRKTAPRMHNVLVTERNAYMAAQITRIAQKHKNVLVVVGAGHAAGLQKLLKSAGLRVRVV